MATPAQIQANRMNSAKSTGPRSVEGKAASRFNAVRNGIDAQSLVVPGEDRAELEDLARRYDDQYRPQGPVEAHLVQALIRADWNQRRLARVETQLWNVLLQDPSLAPDTALGAVFANDGGKHNSLQRIFRRQEAVQRDWFRTAKELRRLQQERQSKEELVEEPIPEPPPNPENWLRSVTPLRPAGAEATTAPGPSAPPTASPIAAQPVVQAP